MRQASSELTQAGTPEDAARLSNLLQICSNIMVHYKRDSPGNGPSNYHPSKLFPSASMSGTDNALPNPRFRHLLGASEGRTVLSDMHEEQL
jgi:hypothetical protein